MESDLNLSLDEKAANQTINNGKVLDNESESFFPSLFGLSFCYLLILQDALFLVVDHSKIKSTSKFVKCESID